MALGVFATARGVSSLIVEILEADGRPDVVTPINVVAIVVGSAAMVACCRSASSASASESRSGQWCERCRRSSRARAVVGLPLTKMLDAIRAPLLAALAMIAVLLPLEAFAVQAGDQGTATGGLLVALEAALGLAIYAGTLRAGTGHPGGVPLSGREDVEAVQTGRRDERSSGDVPRACRGGEVGLGVHRRRLKVVTLVREIGPAGGGGAGGSLVTCSSRSVRIEWSGFYS